MTFQIDGSAGKYDTLVKDESVRYGRNAVENNLRYMESPIINDRQIPAPILEFSPNPEAAERNIQKLEKFADENDKYIKSLPPLEFEYRYMPDLGRGNVDKKALMGAALEEMGTKELSVKEFENRYMVDDSMTAEPLDINKDGKIDVSEYGANILAADIMSKNNPNIHNVDGTINSKGLTAVLEYTKKSNAEAAQKLYSSIYSTYNLSEINELNPEG